MSFALKVLDWFLWGLFLSIGLALGIYWDLGNNLINFIGALFHK